MSTNDSKIVCRCRLPVTPATVRDAVSQLIFRRDLKTFLCRSLFDLPSPPLLSPPIRSTTALLRLSSLGAIDQLPCYVANSPDSMPYVRMIDSDFQMLMERMDKMQTMLVAIMSVVSKVQASVHDTEHNQSTGWSAINRPQHPITTSQVDYGNDTNAGGRDINQPASVSTLSGYTVDFPVSE